MTNTRAALYLGGAILLGAWLASAASLSLQPAATGGPQPAPPSASPVDHLALNVQAQARRLRERLSTAPAPQPVRNPFAFASVPPAPRRSIAQSVATAGRPPVVVEAPEPVLGLIGIAEHRAPEGVVRSAMLLGPGDDVILAKVGETVIGRYKVTAIAADAIELTDPATGQVRRLSIQ